LVAAASVAGAALRGAYRRAAELGYDLGVVVEAAAADVLSLLFPDGTPGQEACVVTALRRALA